MFSLPVEVMWVSKCKYDNIILDKHTHKFYHMFFIRNGEGSIFVDGKDYTVSKNDVYFCHPEIVHGLMAQSASPLNTIEVKFTVIDTELSKLLETLQHKIECKYQSFPFRLEELVMEALHKPRFYKEIVNTGFTRILFELVRNDENFFTNHINEISETVKGTIKDKEGNCFNLLKIIDYINENYHEKITLKKLSDIGAVSLAHLNKLFRKNFNVSPMQYINNLRILKAKELMMYSDFNITQISELVGFQSIHYFSRCFKEKEKVTPNEFRKDVKDNIYIYL
ncbi:MAG: helix-turn-helix transcriptional regulator [Firmicutes bacterium]|nr:helix-turn-helix transcriptional regulator [Bacillota bacterium]